MLSVADYEAWKAKQQQVKAKASAFVVGQAEGNPDELARDMQLATDYSAATGAPKPLPSMVSEYRSVFQAAIEKTRAETILSSSPRLTDWLRNPENATLAKDDLETLSWWESAAIVPRGVASALPAFNEGFYNLAGTVAALPGKNRVSDEMFRLADVSRGIKETTAGPSGNWLGRQVQGASQSIGMMTPGLLATYLSGGAAAPVVMGAYIAPGAISQGGQSARAGIDAGLSPERALLYGGTDAAAEVLFERIPVGRLLGDIAQGSGFGKILAGQLATEIPTEVGTTLFQNLNEWVTLNPDKPMSEFVAEQPEAIRDTIAQTFLATVGLSGLGAGVSRLSRMQEEQAKARDAEGRVTLFQELSGQSVNSKLRARMPERFRQFVEQATANGPLESVYVPASEFVGYFQTAGIDPYALVDELDGVTRDDLDAALAGGGDLKIPTATYAAKIAGSEHDAFLMENMRFDPLDMTAREAAEFNARADEIMQEMWAEAEDIRQEDERWRAVEEKIHDQVVSEMRAAGLSTERAMAEVQPVVAFYRTRAARMGLTTEEYLARNPLPGIQGTIPQGMQFKNVDELNRTLAEARARRAPAVDRRQSLLEFISDYGGIADRGGELKARDAAVIKRPGKSSLRLARDTSGEGQASMFGPGDGKRFGPDDVARAAIEAGFMADSPVVMEYRASLENGTEAPDITRALWDAIDAELRGQKQASEQDAAPVDEAYLDDIEAYLNRLGLDLSNTDEEIRAAIERDQAAPDRMYGQFAGPQSETADIHALATAKDRIAAGENEDKVRRETGWFRGPDLKWRYEITDEDARIKSGVVTAEQVKAEIGDQVTLEIDEAATAKYRAAWSGSIRSTWTVFNASWNDGANRQVVTGSDRQDAMDGLFDLIAGRRTRQSGSFNPDRVKDGEEFSLGDVLDHDRLYAAYPDLALIPVKIDNDLAAWGQVNGYGSEMILNVARIQSEGGPDALLSTLLHEVQHLIQRREGFARGGNTEMAGQVKDALVKLAAERKRRITQFEQDNWRDFRDASEARKMVGYASLFQDFQRLIDYSRMDRPSGVFRHIRNATGWIHSDIIRNNPDLNDEAMELYRRLYTLPRSGLKRNAFLRSYAFDLAQLLRKAVPQDRWQLLAEDPRKTASLMRALERESAKAGAKLKPYNILKNEAYLAETQADKAKYASPFEIYQLLAGEVEARNTENRMRMTEEERRKTAPEYTATADQIAYTGEKEKRRLSQDEVIVVLQTGEITSPFVANSEPAPVNAGYPRTFFQDGGAVPLLFQNTQGPRGQIAFNMDGSSLIRLFETANLSTLQHEMGHFFLTMMQRDVGSGDPAAIAEYEVIKTWWRENAKAVAADGNRAMPDAKLTAEDVQRAIDIGTTGDMVKDAAIDVGMQEQWARGYEAYLMEGKAPSVELRSAFEKFRSWLISVYRNLVGLNVQINDDIRGVFDRMLATDEEIAKAKQSAGENRPIFTTAEQMGLTQEEFDRLMKLRTQAEDEAKARLLREIMEPIKRQREAWWKEERAKTEEDVTRQVNAMPVFRALEWLGNRRWLGDNQPEALPDMRMSKDILIDRYGEGVLKTLPRGMQTVYTVEGGMDPDEVAGWFGFDSGDAMIRALERAPKRLDAIKAETDRVMNERHGDALNDGEIEAIALDALHSDRKGEYLAAELKAVAEVAGVDLKITMKDARATARATIARMKVRDATAAMRFLAAERKAGEEAARLGAILAREGVWMQNARRRVATKARAALRDAGTVDAVAGQIDQANRSTGNYNETVQKLIDAKRRQLINHALFMEARLAGEEVAKAERFVQRLNKASMRERIAGAGRREGAQVDYLAAIDDILDLYDFRKMSGRAEQRRGALVAFVDAMKAAGRENELAIPEAVLKAAQMKPYKTLTVEELRGVIDSLKNLQHIALRWNDLIDAQNQRKMEEVIGDITAAFDANLPKRPPGRLKTTGESLRNSARQFIDLVLNAGTILREIDGFKDMGAAYRNLKAPIDAAMDRLAIRKEQAAKAIEDLYSVYSKDDRRKMAVRKVVPGIPFPMSKWEMISVALNTGNEGNYQRLTDPKVRGSLTPDQVSVVLNSLDARDADFVQSVWDYIGSFREDIAARERRTTGVEPAWVEAVPVQIAGKTLKGGYYPLKYDARLSTLARDDEAQSMAEALQAGRFGKAQTRRGHLEARAQSSGRDIELDMSVMHRHVNQVIYDLELSEPVANSWKVLQSAPVRQAFIDAGRQADFDALEIWLKDTAEGQLNAGDLLNRSARRFKSNFTAAKLAFNLGTVAAQVTGLAQTMVVVGKRDFLRGLQASFRPGIYDQVAALSPFMRQRQTTFNKDVADFYDDPSLGPLASRWGEIKREWIGPASFWLMTKVQWTVVDVPTWLGGFNQGLRMYDGDQAKAVAHADAIVKRAQASGLFSDRSAIERGSVSRATRQNDVIRLFTTLGSYMFAKFNVAYERASVGARVIRNEGMSVRSVQEAASLTLDMAFLFTVEAIIMAAIRGILPDEEDDKDGDGTGDEWAKFLAKETAFSVLGTVPFVRDVASFGQGFEGGGAYGGIIAEIGKPFVEVSQGQIDKGMLKSVISATGLFLGLPSAQINRAVDAAWRELLEGQDVAPVEYLLGKR